MATTGLEVPQNIQVEYQRLLGKTAHLLLRDSSADELCQMVFEVLREPLKLDVYFHFLVSEDGTHLELASSGGNEMVRAALGMPIAFGQTVCGTVAERCEWMYVPNVQQRTDEMTVLIRSYGIRCYVCQPLLGQSDLLGTFSFGSSQRDSFTEEELDFFALMAQQITLATERRIQNRYMRQLEHQAAAGRMCATLAHEVNNPLETLGNILYLLRDEDLTASGRKILQSAEHEVMRLSETTQRTLDLFQGRRQAPQRTDLGELMEDVLTRMRVLDRVPVDLRLGEDLQVIVVPGEMRQVFYNLLVNAANYSPQGKTVQVSVERLDGRVKVSVHDEGPGIPEEIKPKLFQPFYTTRPGTGNGLGLWVSNEIVQRSGGTLRFESEPKVRPGTTFMVFLPATSV